MISYGFYGRKQVIRNVTLHHEAQRSDSERLSNYRQRIVATQHCFIRILGWTVTSVPYVHRRFRLDPQTLLKLL